MSASPAKTIKKPPGKNTSGSTAATPTAGPPIAIPIVQTATAGVVGGALWLLGDAFKQDWAGWLTPLAATVAAVVFTWWGWQTFRHRRRVNAQEVFAALAKVTLTDKPQRESFKVKRWQGTQPRTVVIAPGTAFWGSNPESATPRIRQVFANLMGVPVALVGLTEKNRRIRLEVNSPAPAPEPTTPPAVVTATRAPTLAAVAAPVAHPATDVPTTEFAAVEAPLPAIEAPQAIPALPPVDGDKITKTARAALSPLFDGKCQVQFTDWWDAGSPRAGVLTYDAAAARMARANRAEIPGLLTDRFPPKSNSGMWQVDWEPSRGRFKIADIPDPLAPLTPLPSIEDNPDLFKGVHIGYRQDGSEWRIALMGGFHWLIAGASGSGKGSPPWGIIRALGPLIKAGKVRLWLIDPKGGAEFGPARAYAHRFAVEDEEAIALLEELVAVMVEKEFALPSNGDEEPKITVLTPETPLDLLIIDELATLTDGGDREVIKATVAFTSKLMRRGRAPGVTVIGMTQDPRKVVIPNRSAYTASLALRLSEAGETNLILGPGARAEGALADLIPESLPGIGYAKQDGVAGFARGRVPFINAAEKRAIRERIMGPPPHTPQGRWVEQPALPASSEPVPVAEVIPQVSEFKRPPAPVKMRDLTVGAHVVLPEDTDPVKITAVEVGEDDVEVSYVYDGETGERDATFDRNSVATPVDTDA